MNTTETLTPLRLVPGGMSLLTLLTLAACGGSDEAPGSDAITEAGLRQDVYALADDTLRGRLVGTPELEEASDWIRDRFASSGLAPAGALAR